MTNSTPAKTIYMDHSATTPTHPEVVKEMLPYFTEHFGNPSSLYRIARESKFAVSKARKQVADVLGCTPDEIFFTAGGTESDNWAIKGAAFANKDKGNHIITTKIEHHAVLHTCEYLKKEGFEITYLPVNEYGIVDPDVLRKSITDRTILISVMMANNEIGTIQPIKEIGEIARGKNIYFHTDAVQAIGNVEIDVHEMKIDMLSLSAHKFYGPKGTGALYIRKGINIDSFIHGGSQENGHRAGTENLPGIIGLGYAIERATQNISEHNEKISFMRDRLLDGIIERIPDVYLNGHPKQRLSNNINISVRGIDGEALLVMLDLKGVCVSTGSACSSGEESESHVLSAISVPLRLARGSVRLTLGNENTKEDIDYVLDVLPPIVSRLRALSPVNN
ncbi:MAG: cysteine desulfurase NifS [Euryarchaeota archaeon]|nr:cysteine desulfurase NifS [Euryarchaeota archaeon]